MASRPVPEDFVETYQRLKTISATMRHYKASSRTISKWIVACGITKIASNKPTPPPIDFAEKREIMTRDELRDHYKIGGRMINRWIKWLKLSPKKGAPPPKPRRPMPIGFAEASSTMTRSQLAANFKADLNTIKRWVRESGVQPKVMHGRGFVLRNLRTIIPPVKMETQYDIAVAYLRRIMPVSPCEMTGRYRENGTHYRVGNSIMSPGEMLEKSRQLQKREMEKIQSKKKEFS